MSMKLSSDKEHLVLDNLRLVHYLVRRFKVTPNSPDYEDIVSIGTIGLVKAAISFDTSKNFTFATYAAQCIKNEIFMHYRKVKKYSNDISIEELILKDSIEDPESNFVRKIVNREEFINLVNIVLNCLDGKQRIAFLYLMGGLSQSEIADKLRINQSQVSRIEAKAIQKVQKIASQPIYKMASSMAIVGNEYRIYFSSKDISKFNKIFATFLQNLTSVEKLPDFKVNCNSEWIIIQTAAHPESFYFIAQIIQEIDDFSMSLVSNKTTVVTDYNSDFIVEKGSQVKQLGDYMLSMNSFTFKDLKLHFPNLSTSTIQNVLYLAKSKGLITAKSIGKYVVNKI